MTDFVFMTLFQHYKLYQFVLTQERADDITKCELDIEPPLVPELLKDGVPKSVWDEEQRIKQIEEMEQKRIQVCYVTILLVLFTGINKESMHFQLWH